MSSTSIPCIGYPSQLEAVSALMAEGCDHTEIMRRTQLPHYRVTTLMSKRRMALKAAGSWTPEKLDKARRFHAAANQVIADALGVGVADMLARIAVPAGAEEVRARLRAAEKMVAELRAALGEDGDEGGGTFGPGGWDGAGADISSHAKSGVEGEAGPAARAPGAETLPVQTVEAEPESRLAGGRTPDATAETMAATAGETAAAGGVEVRPAPPAAPAATTARFTLHSADGQVLHQHERGLTRMPKFFWRGTAAEVAALKRRKPQWRDLKEKAIIG